jgi:arylsulfatase A-like enzyme
VYLNNHAYRRTPTWIGQAVNLPQHFRRHGYLAAGYGKVSHHDFQEDDAAAWSEGYFVPLSNEEDLAYAEHARPNTVVPESYSFYQWGPLPDEWDRDDPGRQQQDTRNTSRAIEVVGRAHDRPFLCALGLFRPHLRWYAPRRYFEMYPLEAIGEPPGLRWDDLEDLPPAGLKMRRPVIFNAITGHGLWKEALQAYMASITYADEQVGRVLDALERGPNARNTIEPVEWCRQEDGELAPESAGAIARSSSPPQRHCRCSSPGRRR